MRTNAAKPSSSTNHRGDRRNCLKSHILAFTSTVIVTYHCLGAQLAISVHNCPVVHRQNCSARKRRSRARSGSRSERTLDAVEHSRTLMEWWPFLIFHRGGLRIKVINNTMFAMPCWYVPSIKGVLRLNTYTAGVTKSSLIRKAADEPFSTRISSRTSTACRTAMSRFNSRGLPYTCRCSRTSR